MAMSRAMTINCPTSKVAPEKLFCSQPESKIRAGGSAKQKLVKAVTSQSLWARNSTSLMK
jgi:hypothetical protein